ncbi:MAG: sugar transferase [Syntrophorhabdaceae bacterium]|nr:sugar transferase [Syntrophorhabdaceae bacterium]
MKRIFDLLAAIVILVIISIPLLIIALLVRLTSKGPVLHWSDRVGINNTIFRMPKFRTMRIETPPIATHLLDDPDKYLTPIGPLLRRFSLDEFPQLWSVLKGDMSLVGPRPALYNQYDLIELRTKKGIHMLVPGITGWAQVNGRDILTIPIKVEYDDYYLQHRSFLFDMKILYMTFLKVVKREGVTH